MTAAQTADELWPEVGIDPVKLALPADTVGYTLRAYRPADEVTPTHAAVAGEEDVFDARERARAEQEAPTAVDLGDTLPDESVADESIQEPTPAEFTEPDEDVPVFLSHRGRLLLFGSGDSLVEFIRSNDAHDLHQLDTWATVVKRVQAADIVPSEADSYELDLVVENLRGGHDAWDLPLLVSAGEIARDLGYALRLAPVISAMAPGSPLDDLDETLRAAAKGGVGGALARRRLRQVSAQQASLGWRTVIGKISDAIDWRD